jgi:3-oxocholest-4-en-26-oate---CoA ligase
VNDNGGFNLSTVFAQVAAAVPDATVLVWRDRRFTYSQMDARVDTVAYYLTGVGLGCHTERAALAGHESGQDHLGIYLRNGNEYLETMVASYRARVAPFNVSFRYVEDELIYLLNDAKTKALVYAAEFAPRVEAIRAQVPTLQILIQVGDESRNALLPDAVDYESVVMTPAPAAGMPTPSPDDLYILYTGGTTGMPKGVLWRQHDIFVSSMGGRPFGRDHAFASYAEIAEQARNAAGSMSLLMIPPFMHGAAQWAAYYVITMGGRLVIPDDVDRMRADKILRLAEREQVMSMPIVGDAIARPLLEEIEKGDYDLSGLFVISNGAAPLTPSVRARLAAALPHVTVTDSVGSSETGAQMTAGGSNEDSSAAPAFTPLPDTSVVSDDLSRVLDPGEGEGWLARRSLIPLGYLGDAAKTARTFPTIDSTRWSVPGDRARLLADGNIELLGRDSVTINSGGEKIFAEEVERAIAGHPAVYDVVVVGRPSERWGSEVVAVVQLVENVAVTDDDLVEEARKHIASYKLPRAIVRAPAILRSPAGKADYRWAKAAALDGASPR